MKHYFPWVYEKLVFSCRVNLINYLMTQIRSFSVYQFLLNFWTLITMYQYTNLKVI